MNPRSSSTCIAVPRAGLGDVLYACMALKFLLRKGKISRGVVVSLPENSGVIELFGLEHVPHYSKLLQPGSIAFSFRNEWRFFRELRRFKGCAGISVLNDTMDWLLYRVGGLVPLPPWRIGNYFRVFEDSLRSKLNRYVNLPNTGASPNPKHILDRYLHLLNLLAPCSLDELWRIDWDTLEDGRSEEQKAHDRETIVIIPDAAVTDKELSAGETVALVRALQHHGPVIVFSQRCSVLESEVAPQTANYRAMKDMLWLLKTCRLLVCSDTFGGHLGGLARARMVVLYKKVRRWEAHWDFWGLPHEGALHVAKGRIHRLRPDFLSEEVPLETCEPVVRAAVGAV